MTSLGDDSSRLLDATLERRLVVIGGQLDHTASTELCAVLMTLDGTSTDPVTLRLSSTGGAIGAAMTIVDTIDAMRAAVTTIATGSVVGPAIAILAVSDDRLITPTATLRPALEQRSLADMSASDAGIAAAAASDAFAGFTSRLAAATTPSQDDWRDSFESGELITPERAVETSLADRIAYR